MSVIYIKIKVSTNGKAKLISFEIPGVTLQFLQVEGQQLEAFSEMAFHSIDSLVTAAKHAIDLEIARVAGIRYLQSRINELVDAKVYIDKLIAMDKIETIKRKEKGISRSSSRIQ